MQSKTTPSFFIATHAHSDIVSNYLRKSRFWEGGLSTVMLHVLASLPKHYAVVDFGANLGWFSLLASSQGHRVLVFDMMISPRSNTYVHSYTLLSVASSIVSSGYVRVVCGYLPCRECQTTVG